MTEYRSEHTGKVVDDAVTQVKDNECKIKWGNILGSPSIENQEDLWNTFLRVSGSNSITGVLRVSRATNIFMCAQRTDITKGTSPSANAYWSLDFNDHVGTAAKDRLGNVGAVYFTNGSVRTDINVYKPEANSTVSTRISIGYDENGDWFTYAPTPESANDNSNKIATTSWVKSATAGSSFGIVHLSGTETITGNKTFSGVNSFTGSVSAPTRTSGDSTTNVATTEFVNNGFVIKSGDTMTGNLIIRKETPVIGLRDNAQTAGSAPPADTRAEVILRDNTNTIIGRMGNFYGTDGGRYSYMGSSNASGTYDSNKEIRAGYDAGGNWYTYAPTPADGDNSTKIATTAWVTSKVISDRTSVLDVLKIMYPVGAIFISTTSTCPMASLFGTWELVAADRVLQGSSSSHAAGTTIAAALPNIYGNFIINANSSEGSNKNQTSDQYLASLGLSYGAFTRHGFGDQGFADDGEKSTRYSFAASNNSSVYKTSATTVQPPAYVVNIWRRTR